MADQITFTRGVPPAEAFPTEELGECFDAAVKESANVVLQYGQQQGYGPLRQQLAEEYGVSEMEVVVGNGSLQLQDLFAAQTVVPGGVVYTEQPSYDRAILTFRRRGGAGYRGTAGGGRYRRRAAGGGAEARGPGFSVPGAGLPEPGGRDAFLGEAAAGGRAGRRV